MLTAAQKHKLIKEYNQEREQKWEDYQEQKKLKKTNMGVEDETGYYYQGGQGIQEDGQNYKKIHKILATNNKNKDVREEIKGKLNERPENQLSPGMWLTLNPQYTLDQNLKSTFKDNF